MKNREKYAERIIDMAVNNIAIAIDKQGRLCDCDEIRCSGCMWYGCNECRKKLKEWSEQECVEPAVDWSKVPVDTKVLVKESSSDLWFKRHFARYENNRIYVWANGATSYSAGGDVVYWPCVKLAEGDEE